MGSQAMGSGLTIDIKKLWGQALQLTSTAQYDIALRAVMELKYKLRKLSEQNNPNQGKSYGARPYI
jgi:hypothetical protein